MNNHIAIELAKQDEGLRLTPYQDKYGHWTIGWGTNIERIDLKEADWLLQNRIEYALIDCMTLFTPDVFGGLSRARQAVLINMAYNMGRDRFGTFKQMIKAVKAGGHESVVREMLDSKWAKEDVGYRAVKLSNIYRTGLYKKG